MRFINVSLGVIVFLRQVAKCGGTLAISLSLGQPESAQATGPECGERSLFGATVAQQPSAICDLD
jgi:hypothetical protein